MSLTIKQKEELTMYIKLKNKLRRNIKLDYLNTFITNLNMQSSIWVLYLAYCGLSLAKIGLLREYITPPAFYVRFLPGQWRICWAGKEAWS